MDEEEGDTDHIMDEAKDLTDEEDADSDDEEVDY